MAAQSGNGATPLHLACRSGFISVVQLLFAHDMDITGYETQALAIAAEEGHLDILKLLVTHGVDVFKHGGDAMIKSSREGHLEVVRFLTDKNALVDYVNFNGWTPLLTAIYFNRTDVVQYLLDQQANVDVYTPDWHNGPVDWALNNYNLDILKMLVKKRAMINYLYKIDHTSTFTPLHHAVMDNSEEIVHFLLSNNATVNMLNHYNNSALHFASLYGRADIFGLLVEYGADITQPNYSDFMPPHLAAYHDRVDVIRLVMQMGYKIKDFVNTDGYNLLHYAAANGSVNVTEYLLSTSEGKNMVNHTGKTGRAPLHQAAEKTGAAKVVKFLLDHGADVNTRTVNMAIPLMGASKTNDLDMVKLLVIRGADVNLVDIDGNSSLHIACDSGNYETAVFLLSNGANVNVVNKNRITPLHFATRHNVSLVELLLINKANPFAFDKYGSTVLHYAARFGNLEVVKLLLQWDVNVLVKRIDGFSPMDLATQNGFKELASFLANHM